MFLPPTIDLSNSEQYTLSLRFHPDEFMFSLSKPNEGRNYCLRGTKFEETGLSMLERIQKIIYELNFLTQQYAKTNVIFVSPEYSLVPIDFYENKEKESLYSFEKHDKQSFVMANENRKYGVVTLQSVEKDIYNFLKRSLYNPQFYNHTELLINLFEGKAPNVSMHAKMYIFLHDDLLDIICFNGRELLNSVSYKELTTDEKLYFILKTWESLSLDQMKDHLLIAGDFEEEALDHLRAYIKNIERLASPSEIFLWHKDAQKAPLDLISLSL